MGGDHPDGGRPLSESLPIGVRRARPEDRTTVLNFASRTWDGWDYIPDAWGPWLEATDGVLLVAEAGADVPPTPESPQIPSGQPIAIARVTMLSDVDAWLEGMRVDPVVRGRDVGTNFLAAQLAWAAAQGATFVRYAAGEDNLGSHRLGARHGFELLSRWLRLAPPTRGDHDPEAESLAPVDPNAADDLRVPTDADEAVVEGLLAMIDADPTFALGDRLYEARAWAFAPLTGERFRGHVGAGEVYAAGDRAAVAIVPEGSDWNEVHRPRVALLCGDGLAALPLVEALRAAATESLSIRLPAPDPPMLARPTSRDAWAAAALTGTRHELHVLGRSLDAASTPLSRRESPGSLVFLEPPKHLAHARW